MLTEEIIKALRDCAPGSDGVCRKCPAYKQSAGCISVLHESAAAVLESVVAENEILQQQLILRNDQMLTLRGEMREAEKELENLKSEHRRAIYERSKLEQDKFKQSMEREATFTDYMELAKIEDEKTRNEVLESIGTANFRNELSSALAREEMRRKISRWVELVAPFAEKIEKQDTSTMEFVKCLNRFHKEDGWEQPHDAGEVKYFYRIEKDYGVYLYRERAKSNDPDEERRKREREAEQAEFDRKNAEFEEITDRHYNLRTSFLMEFGSSKKKTANIRCSGQKMMPSTEDSPTGQKG